MSINIRNKTSVPYGVISIDYEDPFLVDGKKINSVLEYVTSINGNKFHLKFPYNLAELQAHLENEKTNLALQKGIAAKASMDPHFEGVLLTAETRPILYVSENHYLGADLYSKNGENVYGKWLTNYKNLILETSPEVYYNIYVLNRFLSVAINFESLEKFLEMARKGIGTKALIGILADKYGPMVDLPSRAIVEETRAFSKRNLSFRTEEIILNVMKSNIRNVRTKNLNSFSYKVFETFVTNVMQKYGFEYDTKAFIKKMDPNERSYDVDRVFEGYTTEVLSGEIQALKPDNYIPTKEEIARVESLELKGVDNVLPYDPTYAIVDGEKSVLSLKDDRIVFNVDGRNFPSLSHYLVYEIGTIIGDFNSYNMIVNSENGLFYSLEDSTKFLNDNIKAYFDHTFNSRLHAAFYEKIKQKKYLADFVKSTGNRQIAFKFSNPETYTNLVNEFKKNITWNEVMALRGEAVEYVNCDPFFAFVQKEMFFSFLNIINIIGVQPTHDNVKVVYQQFFGNVPGTVDFDVFEKLVIDFTDLADMNCSVNNILSNTSLKFLKKKFINRILYAELLSKKIFNNTNALFMTKFLIIEARQRMENGNFLNPKMRYSRYNSKEYLALAKVCNAITICNGERNVKQEIVDKAFDILNNKKKRITFNPVTVDVLDEPISTGSGASAVGDSAEVIIEEKSDYDESGDEAELEGYDSPDENYDDLVYSSDNKFNNADDLSRYIFKSLNADGSTKKYIDDIASQLSKSLCKNTYRINLYQ